MARITITQAAKAGYKSRATINRDVRAGKLSAFEENGRKVVDVADLIRLYGEPGAKSEPAPAVTAQTAIAEKEIEDLKAANARLETELREVRDEIKEQRNDAAKERERLIGIVESHTKQIEDMRAEQSRKNEKKGLLARLQENW